MSRRHPHRVLNAAVRAACVAAVCASAVSCGGAAPLLHTAHVVSEGDLTAGAGFSGTLAVGDLSATNPANAVPADFDVAREVVNGASVSPGLAPWVGGRYGLGDHYDAGLTYSARSIRVDGRREFVFGDKDQAAVSLGLGASGLLPKRDDDTASRVGGFGADVPLLVGWRSTADIYSVWAGVRGGAEFLNGQHDLPEDPTDLSAPLSEDISGWHVQAGGLVGVRVGFRYIYAAFEVAAAMHWAEGEVGGVDVTLRQFTLAPAGALIGRF